MTARLYCIRSCSVFDPDFKSGKRITFWEHEIVIALDKKTKEYLLKNGCFEVE